jgi:hypothetical protein
MLFIYSIKCISTSQFVTQFLVYIYITVVKNFCLLKTRLCFDDIAVWFTVIMGRCFVTLDQVVYIERDNELRIFCVVK